MTSRRFSGREWPLLLGMAVAVVLVLTSMRVSSDAREPDGMLKAAAPGRAPNVASPLAPASEPSGTPASAARSASSKARPTSAGRKKTADGAAAAADAPAADAPAANAPAADAPTVRTPSSGGDGGGGSGAPRREQRGPDEARPGPDSPNAPSRSTAPPAPMFAVKGTGGQVTAKGITFTMSAPTHRPVVGQTWALEAGATRGGRALSGRVVVDAVYQGEVVAHMHSGRLADGSYEHSFTWPAEAAGHPLTVKVTITAGGVSRAFLYDVVVRPAG